MSADPRLHVYAGRRVFVTGHTGFKGAWLAAWLRELGAEVAGFSHKPAGRGAYNDLDVASMVDATIGDVTDFDALNTAIANAAPDVVFHLAAQPLVQRGWTDRRGTFASNVMGTVNVVEASLSTDTVRGVVCVTTDKVYENNESGAPFKEGDRLGGHDPYSASKAAAELAIRPYRRPQLMGLRDVPVVSARAGNVIGGGDWSAGRLIPDIARALEAGENVTLRRPDAVRPWQHVLDAAHGYLLIGAAMLTGTPLADAYNFAHDRGAATVLEVTRAVVRHWGEPESRIVIEPEDSAKEAGLLTLDASLARADLGWRSAWSLDQSIEETVRFYRDPTVGGDQLSDHMCISGEQ